MNIETKASQFRGDNFQFISEYRKAPLGEEGRYVNWVYRFDDNLNTLFDKFEILAYNLDKGLIKHSLFNGVKKIIPIFIQTEGIFDNQYGFSTHRFINALENLEHHKKAGTIHDFLK